MTVSFALKIKLWLSVLLSLFFKHIWVSHNSILYCLFSELSFCFRCPRLKRLVMPAWNRIKKTGICTAIRMWEDLESLTMPSISNPPYLMEEIAKNCKNFAELKIMGPCDLIFASTLAAYLPNLKVLSLRFSTIWKDALIIILERLPNLEVLNISHCLLLEVPPPPAPRKVLKELDESILEKASHLRDFLPAWTTCALCASGLEMMKDS